jgi:hypothetical protein
MPPASPPLAPQLKPRMLKHYQPQPAWACVYLLVQHEVRRREIFGRIRERDRHGQCRDKERASDATSQFLAPPL